MTAERSRLQGIVTHASLATVSRVSAGSPARSFVVPAFALFYSRVSMQDHTETLKVGSRAPEFALGSANRDGVLTLSGFLKRGVFVAEFLRGTW